MKLAITIVHNKSDAQNEAQITALASLLETVTDGPFTNPDTGETWTTTHHEIKGLAIPHGVRVYQVIPFGVTPPPNRYAINSGGIVQFGENDTDKTGNHPRFFNWGLKRGTDHGAEVCLYIEDVSKFDPTKLQFDKDFSEEDFGKVATLKLLIDKGQLDEKNTIIQGIEKYKEVGNG